MCGPSVARQSLEKSAYWGLRLRTNWSYTRAALNFCHVETEGVSSLVVSNSCNPMDSTLPGSSVHGIFQARKMEWVAIPFSRGIFQSQGSNPDLLHCKQILSLLSHPGKILLQYFYNISHYYWACIKCQALF